MMDYKILIFSLSSIIGGMETVQTTTTTTTSQQQQQEEQNVPQQIDLTEDDEEEEDEHMGEEEEEAEEITEEGYEGKYMIIYDFTKQKDSTLSENTKVKTRSSML